MSLRKVDLHPNVVEEDEVENIFVAYEFLRPNQQLESNALAKQNNPFAFNFSKGIESFPNIFDIYDYFRIQGIGIPIQVVHYVKFIRQSRCRCGT